MNEFIIQFDDLSWSKQEDLIKAIAEAIKAREDIESILWDEVNVADPTDPARLDPDVCNEWIDHKAREIAERSSTSLIVEIKL